MTKRVRTLLFIFLVIVFLFVGPGIIFYSQGYRFDFSQMKYLETGGIYVKTNPGEATVSIDGNYTNRISGFSRDLLVQNLLPKSHTVKIEKEGYYSWEKTLEVKEKIVSEAKYVILFPKDNPFALIESDVKNFYPLPDGNNFILLTVSNELFSYNADKNELKKLFNNKQTPYNISDIVFSSSGKKAYIKTENGLHYLLNLENPALSLIKNFSSKTQNIFFNPNDEGSFYYQSNNQIFEVNVEKMTGTSLFKKEKVDAFTLANDSIYSFEKGEVIRTNILLNTTETMTAEPFKVNASNQYELALIENDLFLIENKKIVYLLNKETKTFDKIIEGQSEVKYTPFYDRVLFATDNDFYLLLLKDTETPFFEKAYSVISISKTSEKIGDIKWLNGDYFVYTLNGKVNISEIDNRDKINSFSLDKDSSKIFFNGNTKKLFILDQNEFMVSENKVMP